MREFKARSGWRIALLLFVGWSIVGFTFAAVSYTAGLLENSRQFDLGYALRLNLIQFYLWGAFSPLLFWFSRRFTIEFRPVRVRNLVLHLAALIVFAVVHQTVHLTLLWSVTPRVRQRFPSIVGCYQAYFGFGFYIDLIIALLITIAVHALLYYHRFRASEAAQAALKTQLAQSQLTALKMQLHPHFLFNTLHSISSLVLEDPPKANSMIARLGDFLRLTLEHSDQQLVTLQDEMEFVRCYLEIEQVRFGDRLTVVYEVEPETVSAEVPHLILQPVVENAIRHAIAPHASPGRITIAAREVDDSLRLEVRDTGPGMKDTHKSATGHGMGLSNVRARLERIYGAQCSFEITSRPQRGVAVVMQFPLQPRNGASSDHP
ncbi:MAG TPA: histidine kinase [Chthoniobacterales bacterium]|nr:histidine kinase [Chthoniobacterales bacterium]